MGLRRALASCSVAVLLVASAGCARGPRVNVLLVTLDTTRRDRIGAYGSTSGITPTVDGLAREGVTFLDARTQVPVTLPSHSCLMTGMDVLSHGVRENGTFALGRSAVTLAEVMGGKGYRTAAFVSSYVLDSRFGLDQGFTRYDDEMSKAGRSRAWQGHTVGSWERPADLVTTRAVDWITRLVDLSSDPFFVWVHYFDPHQPWEPPGKYRNLHPYDGEVAFVDSQLDRLVGSLGKLSILDRTLVVVASDHGESVGEHGTVGHGRDLYEPAMRAVLVMRLPGTIPAGERPADRVWLSDVGATILDVTGIGKGLPGRSLAPLWRGETWKAPGAMYLETMLPALREGKSEVIGILDGPWKLVAQPASGEVELYNVEKDPAEEHDVSSSEASRTAAMRESLASISGKPDATSAEPVAVDEETRRRLEALGYFLPAD